MNREFLHKITLLGCLFLLITSSSGTDNGFQTPEQYAQIVQEHFANEEWEAGKELLEEGLQKYPNVSDLEWLMGKYWFHEKNYDQSRYHLVKAIDDNYNNVNAKHLLVDVEDITENYSSAICYVNELLEVNPYWRGLWRRKIELYRKQNNDVEADRLLKRINQIYPNDTILRKDYIYSMEVGYQQMKKGGNRKEAIERLTELIKVSPQNEEYYLDIINLHLQEGNREAALGWSSNGLAAIPGSGALIVKRASILSELARYPEALAFIREQMKRNNSPAIRRMYNDLLMEAATTRSPGPFSTGMDSPVRADSSTEEVPSVTSPSTGMEAPGLTKMRSPTATSSTGISTSAPSRRTVAVLGARSISRLMASLVFPLERVSRYLPRVMRVRIMPADSK